MLRMRLAARAPVKRSAGRVVGMLKILFGRAQARRPSDVIGTEEIVFRDVSRSGGAVRRSRSCTFRRILHAM